MKETAMANVVQATPQATPTKTRVAGRRYFWLGLALCLLSPIVNMLVVMMGYLGLPWYALVLSTAGVGFLVAALVQRFGIARIVCLALFGLFCGFQWYLVVFMSKLPAYDGPARVGSKLPAFATTKADGSAYTEKNLETGQPTAFVFFRGRW
jgi:hypothetical protein